MSNEMEEIVARAIAKSEYPGVTWGEHRETPAAAAFMGAARAALSAIEASGSAIVPREATEEMIAAARATAYPDKSLSCYDVWSAMVAASPGAKEKET